VIAAATCVGHDQRSGIEPQGTWGEPPYLSYLGVRCVFAASNRQRHYYQAS
jgi:hypothetical protein